MSSEFENESPTDADEVLVSRAQSGDTLAFDQLVVRYSPRLYGMIYHMTSNKEDANDLTQDVFAKAYRSQMRYRRNNNPSQSTSQFQPSSVQELDKVASARDFPFFLQN